jgi:hypothetical protein
MIPLLLIAGGVAASAPKLAADSADKCKGATREEVVVCGRSTERYRIDRSVLQAEREADAPPPKPPVTADAAPASGCVGGRGEGCTGAGVVPFVGMALAAAKATELAATGGDWRDAIRIHEDEYRLYKEAEARKKEERKPRIGFGVRN